jgi:hypothetical protein
MLRCVSVILKKGKLVLVGLREWENVIENKSQPQKCDLLEVYAEHDKDKLKLMPGNWSKFISNDNIFTQNYENADNVDFIDDVNEEYKKIMEEDINFSSKNIIKINEEDEEINIDDI